MCFDDWEAGSKQVLGTVLGETLYKARLVLIQLPVQDKQLPPSVNEPSNNSPHPWCNSCKRMAIHPDELYGPSLYNFNFCFPYHSQTLETDEIKHVPFVPRLHAEVLFQNAITYPGDFRYMYSTPPGRSKNSWSTSRSPTAEIRPTWPSFASTKRRDQ